VRGTLSARLINGSADPVSGAHMVARYRELVGTGYIAELPASATIRKSKPRHLVLEHLSALSPVSRARRSSTMSCRSRRKPGT
jgi:hypothetical protein